MIKNIPTEERLIFALDVPSVKEAQDLVDQLGNSVQFYKLGLELFMAGGYIEFVRWLRKRNKKVFADLKFFDVPKTVARAVSQLNDLGVSFVTVHGDDNILKAAVNAISEKSDLQILAVTVLTSLNEGDIRDLGFNKDILGNDITVRDLVLSRAKRAHALGCAGVISSGLEAPILRQQVNESLIIVTPGIRPVVNKHVDDQKRTVDVEEAFENGADYIVVGRPIRDHHNFDTPQEAAESIQGRIAKIF